jgi:two-component system cell cycle sensor histidine kinase/response regulator CckA
MEQDGQPALQACVRDITERKLAEQERLRLVTALEQSAETIVITDPQGTIQYVNPAFEKISGYTRAEVLGRNPRLLKSGRHDAEFYRQMWATLRRGEVWRGRLINQRKDGALFEESATISPVLDAAGQVVNYIALKLDVTRASQLESQLQQAQKLEVIGRLAGGVAHDFNNILTAIFIQASLCGTEEALPAEARSSLADIKQAAERAANLTRQLLLFSRQQALQPRVLDLNTVVGDLNRMLRRILGEAVHLRLHLHAQPLRTLADAGMLDQVLLNLAVNARDAMPAGGQFTLETGHREVDAAQPRPHPDAEPGRYVWLRVSDTGSGISPDVLPHIFEPFFTTKEIGRGTGLGLATVFGIVKQHRGWIEVQSAPAQGTVFQVHFPATTAAPAASPVAPARSVARPAARGGTETILLVEDEPVVRLAIRVFLERQGYRVLDAVHGLAALSLAQAHGRDIALLLTDLVIPEGLDGRKLAAQLQGQIPALKVVFMSGHSPELTGCELPCRPQERYLQKPFSPQRLLETLRDCLES